MDKLTPSIRHWFKVQIIDSDGDGLVNALDKTPIYTATSVNLTLSMTNLPPKVPVLKWFSLANSTNYLYYKTNFTSTNWIVVTNFVQGAANGNVTVIYGRDQQRGGLIPGASKCAATVTGWAA